MSGTQNIDPILLVSPRQVVLFNFLNLKHLFFIRENVIGQLTLVPSSFNPCQILHMAIKTLLCYTNAKLKIWNACSLQLEPWIQNNSVLSLRTSCEQVELRYYLTQFFIVGENTLVTRLTTSSLFVLIMLVIQPQSELHSWHYYIYSC